MYRIRSMSSVGLGSQENTDTVEAAVFGSVATLDLSFFPTARSISTYPYLSMSESILPIIPYIFKNIPTFLSTFMDICTGRHRGSPHFFADLCINCPFFCLHTALLACEGAPECMAPHFECFLRHCPHLSLFSKQMYFKEQYVVHNHQYLLQIIENDDYTKEKEIIRNTSFTVFL